MKFRLVNSDYDYPIKYINKLKEAGFILTDELYGEKLNAYIDINVLINLSFYQNYVNKI